MDCVNLRQRFGRRYRIRWEGDGVTRYQWPEDERQWLMELRCKRGVISPWGGELLQAWTDKPRIGAQLRRLSCVIRACGDEEVVIRFHVDDLEQVLAVLKPYRRRQLSEAQKEQLRAVGFQRQARQLHFGER
jgi:hypothetical protein